MAQQSEDLVDSIRRSTARIVCREDGSKTGSAFIIDRRGLLLTCWHVVEGTPSVRVELQGRTPARGELVWFSRTNDAALLFMWWEQPGRRSTDRESALRELAVAEDGSWGEGSSVFAVGHPFEGRCIVTRGCVSSVERRGSV